MRALEKNPKILEMLRKSDPATWDPEILEGITQIAVRASDMPIRVSDGLRTAIIANPETYKPKSNLSEYKG